MVAYAYLRVSTDHQDLDNQHHGILEYANTHGISSMQFVKDAVSGQVKWQTRAVGKLLTETATQGDVVIFAEISRMARSTLQVLEMLECCMRRGISVHIAKQQMIQGWLDAKPHCCHCTRIGGFDRAGIYLFENH